MEFITLSHRDPDTGYRNNFLWVPKRRVVEVQIKAGLEKWIVVGGQPVYRQLWKETETHLLVPRAYLSDDVIAKMGFPVVDERPTEYERIEWRFRRNVSFRDSRQEEAAAKFLAAENGILNLGTGRGKTWLSHVKMAHLGGPTIVVVHNGSVMQVWLESLTEHLLINQSDIGIIEGPKLQWEKPVVVAKIQTLANRARSGDLPPGFNKRYKLALFDECHHLPAVTFLETAHLFWGHRFGLTATQERPDGLEYLYKFHLGDTFHRDIDVDIPPTGVFWQTSILALNKTEERKVTRGRIKGGAHEMEVNRGLLWGLMKDRKDFVDARVKVLRSLVAQGKKIIALAGHTELLQAIASFFPGAPVISGEVKRSDRNGLLYGAQLTFMTTALGVESLNDVSLDALVALTPYSSGIWLPQSVGRIGRIDPQNNNKKAEFHVIEDVNIEDLVGTCQRVRRFFKSKNYPFVTKKVDDLG